MTQVGRERSDSVVDIFSIAIPTQEPTTGKAVAEVVDSWPTSFAVASIPPQIVAEPMESGPHGSVLQSNPVATYEEGHSIV
jgi:hypothetical protein